MYKITKFAERVYIILSFAKSYVLKYELEYEM